MFLIPIASFLQCHHIKHVNFSIHIYYKIREKTEQQYVNIIVLYKTNKVLFSLYCKNISTQFKININMEITLVLNCATQFLSNFYLSLKVSSSH